MLEAKITIEAPELANAINNLAAAIAGVKVSSTPAAQTVQMQQTTAPVQAPVAPPVQQPAIPVQTAAPVTTAPIATPTPGVPLAQPPKYTVDQIMAAGATLMDAGKINDLINLLHSFGVQAVMDLRPEQLGAFATALREMGAKI